MYAFHLQRFWWAFYLSKVPIKVQEKKNNSKNEIGEKQRNMAAVFVYGLIVLALYIGVAQPVPTFQAAWLHTRGLATSWRTHSEHSGGGLLNICYNYLTPLPRLRPICLESCQTKKTMRFTMETETRLEFRMVPMAVGWFHTHNILKSWAEGVEQAGLGEGEASEEHQTLCFPGHLPGSSCQRTLNA